MNASTEHGTDDPPVDGLDHAPTELEFLLYQHQFPLSYRPYIPRTNPQNWPVTPAARDLGNGWGVLLLGPIWFLAHGMRRRALWATMLIAGYALYLSLYRYVVAEFGSHAHYFTQFVGMLWFLLYFRLTGHPASILDEVWQQEGYDSPVHFRAQQRKWTIAGVIFWALLIVGLTAYTVMRAHANPSGPCTCHG